MDWQATKTRLSEYGIELPEEWEPKINLSGANLRGANLRGANLSRADLSGADLSGADLSWADLSGADLSWANLSRADLSGADLSGADLRWANLRWADLSGADLSGADLSGANLSGADLSGANLRDADLSGANLRWADLSGANLSGANLSGANLSGANLSGADLSGAEGVLDPITWMAENLKATAEGYIVYKRIGVDKTHRNPPEHWIVASSEYLTEVVNPDRGTECGCGVNVGTRKWCGDNYTEAALWRCLIEWRDLPGVIIPFNTDGKIRASRVKLIEIVED